MQKWGNDAIVWRQRVLFVAPLLFLNMNMDQTKHKYIIYARKSSESDEKQVQSIKDQIEVANQIAKDYKLKVVDTIFESKSAKEPSQRAGFASLINSIKTGKADSIICWKIDRLSRNPVDSAEIQWLLQQGIIKSIQTPGRNYVSDDNVLIFSVESSMANQFIRDLSKNVKRGLKSKFDDGWRPGVAPLGWLNTKTEERGRNYLIKDPERFDLLRKCWDLMLTGNYLPAEILDKLNNDWGFKTRPGKSRGGKPMSRSTIYRMFTNSFYAGLIDAYGEIKEGKHEPMVTLEEFDKVQVILGRDGRPRPNRHKYAYTGLIKCGECGGAISATFKEKILVCSGELKQYSLYYCSCARNKRRECSQTGYVNADIIEKQIDKELSKLTILPEFKEWALEILSERNENEIVKRQKVYQSQHKTLNEARKQLDNLTQALIKELVEEDIYKREKARIQAEITRIEKSIKDTENSQDNWIEMTEGVFDFACHAREHFKNGSLEDKKAILSKIGVNCTLKDKKLSIDKHPWLVAIEEHYPELEQEFVLCELDKKPYSSKQIEAKVALSPKMRE